MNIKSAYKLLAIFVVMSTPTYSIAGDSKYVNRETFLNTVGYLTGAADTCKIAETQSLELFSGMSIAINGGSYGDPQQAYTLLNKARQDGVRAVQAKSVSCFVIESRVKELRSRLLALKASDLPQGGTSTTSKSD